MNDARLVKMLVPWERRHPLLFARMRIARGIWLLIFTAILLAYDVWWGVLVLPLAGFVFYTAYRFPRAIRAVTNSHDPK
jgi:hypothetical protein